MDLGWGFYRVSEWCPGGHGDSLTTYLQLTACEEVQHLYLTDRHDGHTLSTTHVKNTFYSTLHLCLAALDDFSSFISIPRACLEQFLHSPAFRTAAAGNWRLSESLQLASSGPGFDHSWLRIPDFTALTVVPKKIRHQSIRPVRSPALQPPSWRTNWRQNHAPQDLPPPSLILPIQHRLGSPHTLLALLPQPGSS